MDDALRAHSPYRRWIPEAGYDLFVANRSLDCLGASFCYAVHPDGYEVQYTMYSIGSLVIETLASPRSAWVQ